MRDPRVNNLARILVGYSTEVKEGETVSIDGESSAQPLLAAIYEEVLKAGANPIATISLDGQAFTYYKHASDAQLEWVSPVSEWIVENVDVRISVGATTNPRELSAVPPERQQRRSKAMGPLMEKAMERSAEGSFRWVYTLFPTPAYAADAEMSLTDYEDFYFAACLANDGDPLNAWEKASTETRRLSDWIQGREEVHVTAPGTDIKLGIAGRKFIPCVGEHNMPGEEYLVKLLDTDKGARRLGELGIGTNYGIDRGTREVLLDEKIGGTVHMALGRSYPESGGVNESAVHTDLVCDLRQGGRMEVDGEVLQEGGRFVV